MAAAKASPNIEPLFASLTDAEKISGISRWTWRQKAYDGVIESAKVGKRLMIPIAEIHRLLDEGRRPRRDGLPAGAPSAAVRRKRCS
jgi:hypothetical protein